MPRVKRERDGPWVTMWMPPAWRHSDSARQALLVTMGGGLALLGGLMLLAQITGTWSLSGIIAAAPELADDPLLSWAIVLVLVGAFT